MLSDEVRRLQGAQVAQNQVFEAMRRRLEGFEDEVARRLDVVEGMRECCCGRPSLEAHLGVESTSCSQLHSPMTIEEETEWGTPGEPADEEVPILSLPSPVRPLVGGAPFLPLLLSLMSLP